MAGRDRSLVARWNDPQTAQTDSANLSTGRNKWTQIAEHRKYDLSLFMITEWRRADRQTDNQRWSLYRRWHLAPSVGDQPYIATVRWHDWSHLWQSDLSRVQSSITLQFVDSVPTHLILYNAQVETCYLKCIGYATVLLSSMSYLLSLITTSIWLTFSWRQTMSLTQQPVCLLVDSILSVFITTYSSRFIYLLTYFVILHRVPDKRGSL